MLDTRLYPAQLARVIDGDTVELDFDVGFHVTVRHSVRLFGINCPEMHGESKVAGQLAKAFAEAWFAVQEDGIVAHTIKGRTEDKYGRYLARIYPKKPGASLNAALLTAGHAVVYMADDE